MDTSNEQILVRLAVLESKLDQYLSVNNKLIQDHEARIRVLEKKIWLAAGSASAIVGTVVSILSQR